MITLQNVNFCDDLLLKLEKSNTNKSLGTKYCHGVYYDEIHILWTEFPHNLGLRHIYMHDSLPKLSWHDSIVTSATRQGHQKKFSLDWNKKCYLQIQSLKLLKFMPRLEH